MSPIHASLHRTVLTVLLASCLSACSSTSDSSSETTATPTNSTTERTDITNAILTERSASCAEYARTTTASALDIQNSRAFSAEVTVSAGSDSCVLSSNSVPNHDFNDPSAHFAHDMAEVSIELQIPRSPSLASQATALSQRTYNGIFLNGVPLDILSAGCYDPSSPQADADGNTPIGCSENHPWLLDPLGTEHKFGADQHNAHTQPGGAYHYHGNPMALFDDNPGPEGSPVIGFAADGFPIYGSYFLDPNSGQVRKAVSGYTLKTGSRPTGDSNPPGNYSGEYISDWAFTDAGDLDACNGMSVNGQYGYYVTDSYPWVMACLSGTVHSSFNKAAPQRAQPRHHRH